jgi:hypothetical protein
MYFRYKSESIRSDSKKVSDLEESLRVEQLKLNIEELKIHTARRRATEDSQNAGNLSSKFTF